MKVSRVEVVPLAIPLEYPFYKPRPMETIFPVVVRLYTDEGPDSFGVCFTFDRQKSLVACIEDLKELVIGTDVMHVAETWQQLFQATKPMGHRGYPVYALSAFDTAIWGLRAAAAGIDLRARLAENDAFGVFKALGDLIVTGPTRTNVNDFRAILIDAAEKER